MKESILLCLFHAHKTNWEIVWKSFTLGATKSASIVRLVSPEECNLFESSMLSSPSRSSIMFIINTCSSIIHRSCNLSQTLFIWWLWTCTKSRFHNWTKKRDNWWNWAARIPQFLLRDKTNSNSRKTWETCGFRFWLTNTARTRDAELALWQCTMVNR